MAAQEAFRLAACGICDGSCFARVRVEDNQIKEVRPVGKDDVVKTRLCVKGAALKNWVHTPQRIEQPMRRVGEKGSGQFEPISWEEAIDLIAARLTQVKEEDGAKASAFFVGHPKWLRYPLAELAAKYGTPNYCTESSTCHTAAEIAHKLDFGVGRPKPDLKNCATLLCWGANPAFSEGGRAADYFSVKERGGKLIVVDPRKTATSEQADIHLALRPGTDGALALAMAHVILKNGWEDRAYLDAYAEGVEEFETIAADMTPEKAAEICDVPAGDIVEAARIYATGGPAALFSSGNGATHCPSSVQNLRAVYLLSALTGNYKGGSGWMLNGFHHTACPRVNVEQEYADGKFPVWNELTVNEGQALGLDLAILESKPYRIRNVIGFAMNHKMFPRSDRLAQALVECEFFVDVDLYWSDTAKLADLVLPACASCERDGVHLLPDNRVLYVPRAIDPGERLNDVEIIQAICAKLGLEGETASMRSFDAYLDWMLKPSGVTLAELKAQPDHVMAARRESVKGELRFPTPSGKIEFKSRLLERHADRPGYEPLPIWRDYTHYNPDPEQFPMIYSSGSRLAWMFHSRTCHLPWLNGLEKFPVVTLNPADAERLGIGEGDRVRLTTPVNSYVFTAQVSPNLREGMVTVMHDGDPSANDLVDADYRDPISGFPGFKSYFCRVEREVQA